MTITASSPWRTTGAVPWNAFANELMIAQSPMIDEARDIWEAAGDLSRLMLAMSWIEQRHGTWIASPIPTRYHNPLSLKAVADFKTGDRPWMTFSNYAQGVRAWRDRITSETYGDGIYARTVSIADLIRVYAPPNDNNNTDRYIADVVAIINRLPRLVVEEKPMPELNMTRGLIPMPEMMTDIIDVSARDQSANCRGYDWLGDRPDPPRFLVVHREQSPPDSTVGSPNGYFTQRCCPALTDLEINSATGHMRRFVERGNAPSGWANGKVSAPYGDALAYLNWFGWDLNAVNRDGEACEWTGYFAQPGETTREDPVSAEALQQGAQWFASRAHDYGITHETFPLIPSEGNRSYITWHTEWTIGTGKVCPGQTLMDGTTTMIEIARSIMKSAQTGAKPEPPPSPYASVDMPPFVAEDAAAGGPRDHVWNDTEIWAARRTFTATKNTRRLQKAVTHQGAPVIGPSVKAGETFEGWYVFRTGGQTFVLTPWGSRISTSGLLPKIRIG